MAVTSGTLLSADTAKAARDETPLQAALVLFTIAGTYAQASGSQLLAVDAFIASQRLDGGTITLISAVLWQPAFDTTTSPGGLLLCAYSIAVSGSNITFNVSENASAGVVDVSTQWPDATALPSQGSPMGFLVTFTSTAP